MIDVCQFLLACPGNFTLYICIMRRLNKRKGKLASQERNHVAKMLGINACVFFICLVPIAVNNLMFLFHVGQIVDTFAVDTLQWIALSTVSLNSAVNPLIYNAFNLNYRKAFRKAFTCRRACTKRQHSPPDGEQGEQDIIMHTLDSQLR